MPSMSYCVFENTAGDFSRCLDKMQSSLDDEKPLNLNQYELPAFENLYLMSQEYIELYDRIKEKSPL